MAKVILIRPCHLQVKFTELIGVILPPGGVDPLQKMKLLPVKWFSLDRIVGVDVHVLPLQCWPQAKLELVPLRE